MESGLQWEEKGSALHFVSFPLPLSSRPSATWDLWEEERRCEEVVEERKIKKQIEGEVGGAKWSHLNLFQSQGAE